MTLSKLKKALRASIGRPLRTAIKTFLLNTVGKPSVRQVLTDRFRSGLVALGECNHYLFPARFVTVDIGSADVSQPLHRPLPLPFPDQSQAVVYAAHVLEHLEDIDHLLAEVRRILKPGGGFRLEVPDVERLVAAYRDRDPHTLDYFRRHREEMIRRAGLDERYREDQLTVLGEVASYNRHDVGLVHIPVYGTAEEVEVASRAGPAALENLARAKMTPEQRESGGHLRAFDFDVLNAALKRAGFGTVRRMDLGRTIIPELKLGSGPRRFWDRIAETPRRAFYSLYIDALNDRGRSVAA